MQSFIGPNLVQGRATVSFDLPEGTKAGDKLTYEVVVTDEEPAVIQ